MAFELSGFTELSGQNVAQYCMETTDSYASGPNNNALDLPVLHTDFTPAEQAILDREHGRRSAAVPINDDSVPIRIADNKVASGLDYSDVNRADLALNAQQLLAIEAEGQTREQAEANAAWEQIRASRAYTTAEIYAAQGSRRPREAATRLAHLAVHHTLKLAEADPVPTLSDTELDTIIIPTLQHMATPSLAEAIPDVTTRSLFDWTDILKLSWRYLRPADSALLARRLEMGLALGGNTIGERQQKRLTAIYGQSELTA